MEPSMTNGQEPQEGEGHNAGTTISEEGPQVTNLSIQARQSEQTIQRPPTTQSLQPARRDSTETPTQYLDRLVSGPTSEPTNRAATGSLARVERQISSGAAPWTVSTQRHRQERAARRNTLTFETTGVAMDGQVDQAPVNSVHSYISSLSRHADQARQPLPGLRRFRPRSGFTNPTTSSGSGTSSDLATEFNDRLQQMMIDDIANLVANSSRFRSRSAINDLQSRTAPSATEFGRNMNADPVVQRAVQSYRQVRERLYAEGTPQPTREAAARVAGRPLEQDTTASQQDRTARRPLPNIGESLFASSRAPPRTLPPWEDVATHTLGPSRASASPPGFITGPRRPVRNLAPTIQQSLARAHNANRVLRGVDSTTPNRAQAEHAQDVASPQVRDATGFTRTTTSQLANAGSTGSGQSAGNAPIPSSASAQRPGASAARPTQASQPSAAAQRTDTTSAGGGYQRLPNTQTSLDAATSRWRVRLPSFLTNPGTHPATFIADHRPSMTESRREAIRQLRWLSEMRDYEQNTDRLYEFRTTLIAFSRYAHHAALPGEAPPRVTTDLPMPQSSSWLQAGMTWTGIQSNSIVDTDDYGVSSDLLDTMRDISYRNPWARQNYEEERRGWTNPTSPQASATASASQHRNHLPQGHGQGLDDEESIRQISDPINNSRLNAANRATRVEGDIIDSEVSWPVTVNLHEVDWSTLTIRGSMIASQIPNTETARSSRDPMFDSNNNFNDSRRNAAAEPVSRSIETFFDGEIIDFRRRDRELETVARKLGYTTGGATTDIVYWAGVGPFKAEVDRQRCIKRERKMHRRPGLISRQELQRTHTVNAEPQVGRLGALIRESSDARAALHNAPAHQLNDSSLTAAVEAIISATDDDTPAVADANITDATKNGDHDVLALVPTNTPASSLNPSAATSPPTATPVATTSSAAPPQHSSAPLISNEPDLHLTPEEENEAIDLAMIRCLNSTQWLRTNLNDWILMRWKEREVTSPSSISSASPSFITDNATAAVQPLTINGFYYVALSRATGDIDALYFDTSSAPFQRLSLTVRGAEGGVKREFGGVVFR